MVRLASRVAGSARAGIRGTQDAFPAVMASLLVARRSSLVAGRWRSSLVDRRSSMVARRWLLVARRAASNEPRATSLEERSHRHTNHDDAESCKCSGVGPPECWGCIAALLETKFARDQEQRIGHADCDKQPQHDVQPDESNAQAAGLEHHQHAQ